MARYTGAVCRLCRREGMKLFLKGTKCHTEKCPVDKRNFAPGQHGRDRKVNIPSFQVSVNDEIKIREGSKKLTVLETSIEFASHQVAPRWLQVDHANLSGKVLALPKREDVNLPVNEQLIVELYSK